MKKFVAIPLVAVMLAALAAPALAEENENSKTLTIPTDSTQIDVEGKYIEAGGATTVYSVDIKWGNMKAIYAPNRTKEWDPEKLAFTNVNSDLNPWTWDRTISSYGLEPNQVAITNKSNTAVTCGLQFLPADGLSISGKITIDKEGEEERPSFTVTCLEKIQGYESMSETEKLSNVTSSGFLQLSGTLGTEQYNFTNIGKILVTLN